MISKATFQFLKQLKANNSKEWFDENRVLYSSLRIEFEHFVNLVIAEISGFDKEASKTTAKASIFRINRDIRFSNDKSPYKTNFGAFIANGGRKGVKPGYYVHIEPGECFLSGGIYMPSASALKAIRTAIADNFNEFRTIITDKHFIRNFGKELWGEKLKTAPKGFPKDFIGVEYLKYKHYTVFKPEADKVFMSADFLNEIRVVFKALEPFNTFLSRALEDMDE